MSLTTADFDYIRDVVRRHSAIVLEPGDCALHLAESLADLIRVHQSAAPL